MHYRLTRPDRYGPGTPGFSNASARQGYYVTAESPEAARAAIREREGFDASERLTVQCWDGGKQHGVMVSPGYDDAAANACAK